MLFHEEKGIKKYNYFIIERCLRLDYLIKKDKIDPKELYRDTLTKE